MKAIVARMVAQAMRPGSAAGVECVSFHTPRHTFASQLKMNGADLDDIRRLMGHGDMRMVQRYAHVGKSHLEAAAARLDGVLSLPAQIDSDEQVTQRVLTKR